MAVFCASIAGAEACHPFHLYPGASVPPPPRAEATRDECVAYYTNLDLNKNGVHDWIVVGDPKTSTIVAPFDPDLDGDGVENIWDADPMDAGLSQAKLAENGLPQHLALSGKRGQLQAELYRRFGILAVDHTDHHSASVLQALLHLLDHGFAQRDGKSRGQRMNSVRILYAFKGHDREENIAAFHPEMKAISIGGETSWGHAPLRHEEAVRVLAALAHEMGHAYVFDQMTPVELKDVGETFGEWHVNWHQGEKTGFQAPAFFESHPYRHLAELIRRSSDQPQNFIRRKLWVEANLVSVYSTTNIHEWFADAFAARALERLGASGQLRRYVGSDWKAALERLPAHHGSWWVNYNNLSARFKAWFDARVLQNATQH